MQREREELIARAAHTLSGCRGKLVTVNVAGDTLYESNGSAESFVAPNAGLRTVSRQNVLTRCAHAGASRGRVRGPADGEGRHLPGFHATRVRCADGSRVSPVTGRSPKRSRKWCVAFSTMTMA